MSSHHAVLFRVDDPEMYLASDFVSEGSFVEYRNKSLTIDDVRKLIADAYRRPEGEHEIQTLIIITNFITEEAQQALLKIAEEPPTSTRFIFVIPNGVTLLPTLLSRFQVEVAPAKDVSTASFKEFLEASLNRRLRLIEDALKAKDTKWQMEIKIGLIAYVGKNSGLLSVDQLTGLNYITRTLLTRGASNKFLLERLALLLPDLK